LNPSVPLSLAASRPQTLVSDQPPVPPMTPRPASHNTDSEPDQGALMKRMTTLGLTPKYGGVFTEDKITAFLGNLHPGIDDTLPAPPGFDAGWASANMGLMETPTLGAQPALGGPPHLMGGQYAYSQAQEPHALLAQAQLPSVHPAHPHARSASLQGQLLHVYARPAPPHNHFPHPHAQLAPMHGQFSHVYAHPAPLHGQAYAHPVPPHSQPYTCHICAARTLSDQLQSFFPLPSVRLLPTELRQPCLWSTSVGLWSDLRHHY
jgi:hypothetical protein